MCGRYSQTADGAKLTERFGIKVLGNLPPRFNIAPSQRALVIIKEDSRQLKLMQWGLIPSWSRDATLGHKLINARSETIAEKPSFKKSLERRRCLVPACGFFEWARREGTKTKIPMRFVLKSREPFAFAGLWDIWKKPDGNDLHSFTIITTAANDLLRPVHDRMPVILKQRDEERWLDPHITEASKLTPLLVPYSSEAMELYLVSLLVNSPKNDCPECLVAV